jgi:hypothetical protein
MNFDPLKTYAELKQASNVVERVFTGVSEIPDRFAARRRFIEVPKGATVLPGYVWNEIAFSAPTANGAIDYSDMNNIDRTLKAIGLVIAEVSGRTPQQVRALFKQKFDSLG